ncbi:hypothetical protein BDK51DRAFT_45074 [Blyttiomyces helicus]|uniref:Uncharacterized protein n=1 Tax=Blyttiomyces helicus TaxID=388810 RepID=A0A4P9W750_9FUNG|nr:hypothetical protein BDK51DRAFT_45074 [Blyttiomyces helicus]|eukprot:RKO88174.1 hypothetical protein BDK51DRAFT_45074 [Blyttiomyces helicus]
MAPGSIASHFLQPGIRLKNAPPPPERDHRLDSRTRPPPRGQACAQGWLDMVALLIEIGAPMSRRIGDFAAKFGTLLIVKLLHEKAIPDAFISLAMNLAAARSGSRPISSQGSHRRLHHARDGRRKPDGPSRPLSGREERSTRAMDYVCHTWASSRRAARQGLGHLKARHAKRSKRARETVFYLHEYRIEGCTVDAMESACKYACAEQVRFLLPIRPACERRRALDLADILQILDEAWDGFKDEVVELMALRWTNGPGESEVEVFSREMNRIPRNGSEVSTKRPTASHSRVIYPPIRRSLPSTRRDDLSTASLLWRTPLKCASLAWSF